MKSFLPSLSKFFSLADRFYYSKALVIDIVKGSVTVLYIDKNVNGIKLLDYSRIETNIILPNTDGIKKDAEGIFLSELKGFIEKNKLGDDLQVILGLPKELIILKVIDIPAPDKKSIKQILTYDIDRHIPAAQGEIYYDYDVIRKKGGNIFEIMLVSSNRKVVDTYVSLLKKLNLSNIVIYISPLAGLNLIKYCGRDTNIPALSVDFYDNEIEFNLIEDNVLVHSKRVHADGIKGSGYRDSKYANEGIVASVGDLIASERENTAKKLIANSEKERNLEVLFTGEDDFNTKLKGYISDKHRIKTDILRPTNGMNTSKQVARRDDYYISKAIGLGLRGVSSLYTDINLIHEGAKKKGVGINFITTVVLIFLFIFVSIGRMVSGYAKDRVELLRLEQRLSELKNNIAGIEGIGIKSEDLKKKFSEFETVKNDTRSKLAVIKELAERLPASVWISGLNIADRNIEISGYANSASEIIKILEDSPLFKDVKFEGTIKKEDGKDRFKVVCVLE